MPTNIQALLDAIPIAEDDHVITAEYHNALRDAIRALAGVGETAGVTNHVSALAPVLSSDGPNPKWESLVGVAKATGIASGWMPVQLPDGALIQKIVVHCRRVASTGTLNVGLIRLLAATEGPIPYVQIAVTQFDALTKTQATIVDTTNIFGAFARTAVSIPIGDIGTGIFPGTITLEDFDQSIQTREGVASASLSTVDNTLYKYLIYAALQASPAAPAGNTLIAGSTQINGIKIFYSQ